MTKLPQQQVVKPWEGVTKGIYRLIKAAQTQGQQSAALTRSPQAWGGGNSTPSGSGGGSGGSVRQWIYIPAADVLDAGSGVSIDATDLGSDIYQASAFTIGSGRNVSVYVNGQMINQGSTGTYPRWFVASSTEITLRHRNLSGPLGVFPGSIVIVREEA